MKVSGRGVFPENINEIQCQFGGAPNFGPSKSIHRMTCTKELYAAVEKKPSVHLNLNTLSLDIDVSTIRKSEFT